MAKTPEKRLRHAIGVPEDMDNTKALSEFNTRALSLPDTTPEP
jgi:hypothetical protein